MQLVFFCVTNAASASKVTTLWHYTNLFIIIIIMVLCLSLSLCLVDRTQTAGSVPYTQQIKVTVQLEPQLKHIYSNRTISYMEDGVRRPHVC